MVGTTAEMCGLKTLGVQEKRSIPAILVHGPDHAKPSGVPTLGEKPENPTPVNDHSPITGIRYRYEMSIRLFKQI